MGPSRKEETVAPAAVTGYDPAKTGQQALTVTVGGKTAQFTVTVVALDSLSIRQNPIKTVYEKGEALDLTGLSVDGYYSDGSRKEETIVPADVTGYDPAKTGQQPLTVTAGGKTARFTVTVQDTTPLKLEIGFPAAGGAGLKVYGLPAEPLKLSVNERNSLPKSILISVGGKNDEVYSSYNGIQWSVDGQLTSVSSSSDNIITIEAKDYAYTIPHTLTLIATKDGVRYSRSIQFTVER